MNDLGIDTINEDTLKSNTLHKDNRTIRIRQKSKLGKEAKILNNFLYQEAQLKIEFDKTTEIGLKYKDLTQYDTKLTILKIREILGLEDTGRYIELIKTAISQLQQPIEIYDIVNDKGNLWKWQSFPFLIYAGEEQERLTGEITYTLGISNKMYKIMKDTNGGKNFTQLNLDIHKKLTSNSISLYEWLKSYQNMGKGKTKGYCPPLNLEKLNDMFFANYKYLSKVRVVLINSIKQINDKTDLVIREVIKENGKKGEIYLQVQESNIHKIKRLDKELNIKNQNQGQEKQSYKVEQNKKESQIINNLMGEES
ncbi:replication initiation protein [Sulfurimonas sp. SAG-AH-194-I05]|nr:replication initiation protein [Sulfurimonas sp. SAG-AH-194-I05]MDF1876030.1 replication initiation protein [Sulfurimonas sp. SAG-AH-194-I05]